jgi:hypothetical protein
MYIKDTYTGNVRKYGTDMHDSLRISNDGTCLTYHHLQCGDGSIEGDKEHSGFLFCDDEGHTPEEDEVLCRNGADAFFNIGGWKEPKPKTGHWFYDKSIENWRCSECNETPKTMGYCGSANFMAKHFKFCNHCGVRMVEPHESEKINCETTKCENCQNHNYCDFEPHKSEG